MQKIKNFIKETLQNNNLLHNPNAGDILKHEFIDEIDMSQNALAKAWENNNPAIFGFKEAQLSHSLIGRWWGLSHDLQYIHPLLLKKKLFGSCLSFLQAISIAFCTTSLSVIMPKIS